MKRDLDLIRYILMVMEDSNKGRMYINDFETDIYSLKVISYHMHLLVDAGFIEANAQRFPKQDYDQFYISRITMEGHDYLDSIRDKNVWDETKKRLSAVGSSASLDIVKSIAIKVVSGILGI